MNPVKVLYIISHVSKSHQLEWTISLLAKRGFQLTFLLMGKPNTEFHGFLQANAFGVFSVPLNGWMSRITAFFKAWRLLLMVKPAIVHTHLYDANLIGLVAGWCAQIQCRVYTRHHATIHHEKFPYAVWVDRLLNKMATHIIIPSGALRNILVDKEGVRSSKVYEIPHGFNLDYFSCIEEKSVHDLKLKYGLTDRSPVIGVIARHTEWKGVQYVITAFIEILKAYPQSHLILANAGGEFEKKINGMLVDLPTSHYSLISFESNVAALYNCFDLFVHVPVDANCEAFGQTYVEALASGIPSIFTLSGIAPEFIEDGVNALVVNYRDSTSILRAAERILVDTELAATLRKQGPLSVRPKFSIEVHVDHLDLLYRSKQ